MLAVVVVLNFAVVLNSADADQKLTVPVPAQGRWTDLLGEFAGSPWKGRGDRCTRRRPCRLALGRLLHHVGRAARPKPRRPATTSGGVGRRLPIPRPRRGARRAGCGPARRAGGSPVRPPAERASTGGRGSVADPASTPRGITRASTDQEEATDM